MTLAPRIAAVIVTRYDNVMYPSRPGRPATGRALSAAERMRRYRARRRAAGLRAVNRWQPTHAAAISPGLLKHRIAEVRSLAMHCLIARKIEADRSLLASARRTLARWIERYGDAPPRALIEWREILCRPWPEVAAIITDADERAVRLRQSSPFAGLLTPPERKRVYETFRA